MKKYKNNFSKFALVLVLLLTFFAGSVFGKSTHETIKVLYNNIKLVVNGQTVKFGKDSAGKTIEPFIYNGTTYLPVRAVGEALGKEVNWDGKNQTVYVGEGKKADNSKVYMTDVLVPYGGNTPIIYKSTNTKKLVIQGKEYKAGYASSMVTKLRVNLNSEYKSLNFDLGAYDNSNAGGIFKIFLDNELYKEFKVSQDTDIQNITVDVTGVNQLRFEFPTFESTHAAIGDPILTK